MKFSIITPTFKRPEKLKRALMSVCGQAHTDWELIVINDNPGDNTRTIVEEMSDSRIIFYENHSNNGVNFCRNRGLDNIAKDSDYVIFLDDDDYLTTDALTVLATTLSTTPHSWLLTARGHTPSTPTTSVSHLGVFSYAWDYLISKKIKGDATHAIASRYITGQVAKLRFPTRIRQAEEWLFYFELSGYTNPYFDNVVTTLTDGYEITGLNYRPRTTLTQVKALLPITEEGVDRGLIKYPLFYVYLFLRVIRAFIKK